MNKKISRMQALMTAVGIMIGVGIYFKADDIMSAVNGNFGLAMFIWTIICIGFIFAGIAAAAIAEHVNPEGGIVGYYEEYFGKKASFIVGWIEGCMYVPILVSVLANVVIEYFLTLMDWEVSSVIHITMAACLVLLATFWNYLSTKLSTLISVSATYLKIIPLIVICILGFMYGNPQGISLSQAGQQAMTTTSFLAPFIAIAFMFDGWINIGSMAVDMKDPKKDLPIVYVASLVITCAVYVLYFIGVNLLMDGHTIISYGDDYLDVIATQFFGENGAKLILIFVVISGIGTMNGMFMSGNRYIEKLADDNLMFCSNFFKKRTKHDTPLNASLFTLTMTMVGLILILLQQFEVPFLKGFLLENAVVAVNSVILGVVFIINFRLFKNKQLGLFKGIIAPIVSMIFVALIFFSYIFTSENILNSVLSIVVIIVIGIIGLIINRKELFVKK